MARKSRKNNSMMNFKPGSYPHVTYDTALYARLSVEDKKTNSNSIDGQISILTSFIEDKPDMRISGIYKDNGYTGANYNRPAFLEMMKAVEDNTINCIIVKDLSRLGRNYVEVMDYIEQVFPLRNVRFISVNDNIDTFSPNYSRDSLFIALKSLLNNLYLQDITEKINAACETMQKNGDFIAGVPSYGYRKSSEDKHKLVVDETAAKTIRQIFQWALEGVTKMNIAKRLNESDIPSPRNYYYQIGVVKNKKFSKKMYWQAGTVNQILKNQAYIGNMVAKRNQDKQTIVEGTHEAIIERMDFYRVGELLDEVKQNYQSTLNQPVPYEKQPAIFKNVACCGHCGKKIRTNYGKKTNKYSATYLCNYCNTHTDIRVAYNFEQLEKTVLEAIKVYVSNIADFQTIIKKINRQPKKIEMVHLLQADLAKQQQKITKLNSVLKQIYLDYSDGVITAQEYRYTKDKYHKQLIEQKSIIEKLKMELEQNTDSFINNSNLNALMQKYRHIDVLDMEIVENMIEKLVVYSGRRIEISFNFSDEFQVYQMLASQEKEV